jgi:hypothetical protein
MIWRREMMRLTIRKLLHSCLIFSILCAILFSASACEPIWYRMGSPYRELKAVAVELFTYDVLETEKSAKYSKPLPFDFYLPDYNMIIEFDGEQHYKQSHFTHSNLSYTQAHDIIKNDYCKNKNIKLIRIPYWELNNIETILNNEFIISHKDIV